MGFAGDGILQVVRGALDLAEDLQVRMGMNGFRFGCRSKQSGRLREAVFFRLLGIGKVFAVGLRFPAKASNRFCSVLLILASPFSRLTFDCLSAMFSSPWWDLKTPFFSNLAPR